MAERAKKVPSLVDQLKRLAADASRALRKHEAAHGCGYGSDLEQKCPDRWILLSVECDVQMRVEIAQGRRSAARLRELGESRLEMFAFQARAKGWQVDPVNGKPVDPRDHRAQEEFELGAVRS
jgi:hypothetical protein